MPSSQKVDLPWFMRRKVLKQLNPEKIRQKLLYPNGAFGTHSPILRPDREESARS